MKSLALPTVIAATLAGAALPASAQTAPAASAPPAAPVAPAAPAAPAPAVSPEAAKAGAMLEITIGKLRSGAPDYDAMAPALAAAVKPQAAAVKGALDKLGAVKSIDYVGPVQTAHQFKVVFENGATVWFIGLAPDGKIQTLVFRGA